jgi:hypothetical protein
MGLAAGAGPERPSQSAWRTAAIVGGILALVRIGSRHAPLCVGARHGAWAMRSMLPSGLFVVLAPGSMLRWLLLGAREDAHTRATGSRFASTLLITGVRYLVPPALPRCVRMRQRSD